MKKLNPILLTTILIFTLSCSYHIGTGDKLNNLKHWKEDKEAKKEAKNIEKTNAVKYP